MPPEHIGPFRLGSRIGEGATALVHEAVLLEGRAWAVAGTTVALKLLRPELAGSPGPLARFRAEAELGQRVDHAQVVGARESGTCRGDGAEWHWLALERIEGRTLAAWIEDLGQVPEALLRDVAGGVAASLAAIHAAGAVHRDLKPENILLTPRHQVKLLDLGLCAVIGTAPERGFAGTLNYAAPEQIRGEVLGPATDLYALGAVLYQASTGSLPFRATSNRELGDLHLSEVPARIGESNARLSRFFEELVACLLEKDPRQRIASASELATVLAGGEASAWWREREAALQRAHPGGAPARIRVPRATAMVGREAELGALLARVEALRAGRGAYLSIEGETGIGKTRLLDELVRALEADHRTRILYGANVPDRAAGAGALGQALLDCFGRAALPAELARLLQIAPEAVHALAAELAGDERPPGVEPLAAGTLLSLLAELARALARERPLIWIVEDLHFATPELEDGVRALARVAASEPLLLIATRRQERAGAEPAGRALEGEAVRFELGRLASEKATLLVAALLAGERAAKGGPAVSEPAVSERLEPLVEHIQTATGGNPLFTIELLRRIRSAGALDSATSRHIEVPRSIRALLLSRVDGLAPPDRTLIEVAAGIATAFDPDLLARALGRERLDVLEALAALERQGGLVRAVEAGFEFDHDLLREAVLEALTPELRATVHGRIAGAIRERLARRKPRGPDALALASHLLRSNRPRDAASTLPAALDHLAQSHRHHELAELASLALDRLAEAPASLRLELLLQLADSLDVLGRRDQERRTIADAEAIASAAGDPGALLRARLALGRHLIATSDYERARETLVAAVATAALAKDRKAEGIALYRLAVALSNTGRFDDARAHLERAADLARRRRDRRDEATALGRIGTLSLDQGDHETARDRLERALALARAAGDRGSEVRLVGFLGLAYDGLGRFDLARAQHQQQADLARALGHRFAEASALTNTANALAATGHMGPALPLYQRALALGRDLGDRQLDAISQFNIGRIRLAEGKLGAAAEALGQTLAVAESLGIPRLRAYARHALGDLERARGNTELGAAEYQRAIAISREFAVHDSEAMALFGQGRLLAESGDREGACLFLGQARAIVERFLLSDPGQLPAIYLCWLEGGDAAAIAVSERATVEAQLEAHAILHRAGGDPTHLARSRALLELLWQHLDASERAEALRTSPLARFAEDSGSR